MQFKWISSIQLLPLIYRKTDVVTGQGRTAWLPPPPAYENGIMCFSNLKVFLSQFLTSDHNQFK